METKLSTVYLNLARLCLFGLIVLCLSWELWLAPLRPGGSLLALKAVPLLFAVRGVSRASLYTLQWVAMLSLVYLMEGVVRAWSDISVQSQSLAWVEIVLASGLYLGAILYVQPAKKAARKKPV